jgi:hypothetical protein
VPNHPSTPMQLVDTPTIASDELLRRFFAVIEAEAATNSRFKHALIAVLTNVAVAVPAEDGEADFWNLLARVPW